ncbi:DUF3717 domain-containing protein [Paraburkholderia sp. LEh10]|uniref:DUF3717 domain-containing protein n=1 Tax=Paraburkholderia sp. LEh10 TaxID=2821353 RepID=UPI001AE58C60|nr:DUF3717 domain-containing protein [Paraburkholderia sp. LEh10]
MAGVGQAIDYWRALQVSGERDALCANARPLADLYGLVIIERADLVENSTMTSWTVGHLLGGVESAGTTNARSGGVRGPASASPDVGRCAAFRPTLPPASQTLDNHGYVARAARPDRGARGSARDAWGECRRAADRGVTIRFGRMQTPVRGRQATEGSVNPPRRSRGGWIQQSRAHRAHLQQERT